MKNGGTATWTRSSRNFRETGDGGGVVKDNLWPALPLAEWEKTYATLHMWMQVVGKVRLAQTPLVNHWWNTAFYVTARGIAMPATHYRDGTFQVEFDFLNHQLEIRCHNGSGRTMPLRPLSVAEFYRTFMSTLHELGIQVKIWPVPVEVEKPVPFQEDFGNSSYDPEYAQRLWRILLQAEKVFQEFRSGFIGKCSPVHFFWGSFDLAVTRFSGRVAPEREGADAITREAYSHEVISHGFWPGQRASGAVERERSEGPISAPAFYSYTAPEPPGLGQARVAPGQAFYSPVLKEWILLYDDLRRAASPERTLLEFMQTTYDAGAELAKWDRAALERPRSQIPWVGSR